MGSTAGASGGDGQVDAAVGEMQDAGAAGPGQAASCSGTSFCESFDAMPGPELDAARWEVVMPNCSGSATVALDAAVAHSGTQSVRVEGGAGYCNHVFIRRRCSSARSPNPLYARFFVRLQAPLGSAHVTFAALHDAVEDKDLRMGGQSEILMWNRESDDATLPELSPSGIAMSVRPAAQTWTCIELMIDAAGQTLRTWVDGDAVPGLEVDRRRHARRRRAVAAQGRLATAVAGREARLGELRRQHQHALVRRPRDRHGALRLRALSHPIFATPSGRAGARPW